MVDREFRDCTSLQCGRIGLHSLYCQVLTVEIGRNIQTFFVENHGNLPLNIHSTPWSRMMGRKVVQESSQQFLMLKCNTLHMGHYVEKQNEMGQCLRPKDVQSDTQPHTCVVEHYEGMFQRTTVCPEYRDVLILKAFGRFQ